MNSQRKNYPMKEFRAIFSISSILVIRSGYAKRNHFSILAVIQNIWDLHKFGLQIWIHNAKITLWKNFGQFFRFHRFWSSGPGMQKKSFLNISCNSKYMGLYINLGCRFEFTTQKLPYERISGNFSISSILVIRSGYAKKDHFSILAVIQNIWDLHKFGLQIWIHNAKITLWKNFGQFFSISSILVIRSGYAKKDHFSILAVIQNVWALHKFGLQIWIQNAKITLWKNFGQFFQFHRFWSSGPGHAKKDQFLNISCISKYMGFT